MQPVLKFNVRNQNISRVDTFLPVRYSRNYLYAEFDFKTCDWNEKTKTAIFSGTGLEPIPVILGETDTCLVPWEVLECTEFTVTVHAGDLITVDSTKVKLYESGYRPGGVPEPTPDVYQQLINMLTDQVDGLSYTDNILSLIAGEKSIASVTITGGSITPEQISEAVKGYLASNPIEETDPTVPSWAKEEAPDKSLTQEGKAADAKEVGNRLSELSETNVDKANSLWAIIQKTAFTEQLTDAELSAFKTAWGIESGGEVEPDEPTEPDNPDVPEVTLSSISATYSGGDVLVGTALTSLTGITVTATYSDGSTANVADYTLSGTIAEGSNTITVSYGGKTATFTVTGVVENEPEVTWEEVSVSNKSSATTYWYNEDGTELAKTAKARSHTSVFEEETEVKVTILVNSTQYTTFYIGAYDGTNDKAGYFARAFGISGYPSEGKEYTTTYTVPAGYGVMVGGWSNQTNVTVKVEKAGV